MYNPYIYIYITHTHIYHIYIHTYIRIYVSIPIFTSFYTSISIPPPRPPGKFLAAACRIHAHVALIFKNVVGTQHFMGTWGEERRRTWGEHGEKLDLTWFNHQSSGNYRDFMGVLKPTYWNVAWSKLGLCSPSLGDGHQSMNRDVFIHWYSPLWDGHIPYSP